MNQIFSWKMTQCYHFTSQTYFLYHVTKKYFLSPSNILCFSQVYLKWKERTMFWLCILIVCSMILIKLVWIKLFKFHIIRYGNNEMIVTVYFRKEESLLLAWFILCNISYMVKKKKKLEILVWAPHIDQCFGLVMTGLHP